MIRRPPRSTRTDTLFPYTTLFRSEGFHVRFQAALPRRVGAPVRHPHRLAALVTMLWLLADLRSEEHTSELQSLMRISYAVFCLKKKKNKINIYIAQKINTHYTAQ